MKVQAIITKGKDIYRERRSLFRSTVITGSGKFSFFMLHSV